MPLTAVERAEVVKEWRDFVHGVKGRLAKWNIADIRAAADSIDDTLDLTANALTGNQTIIQNINARLVEPFKTQASTPEKWALLSYIAAKRAGIL